MSYGIKNIKGGLRLVELILVLDSNEYIVFLNKEPHLLEKILYTESIIIFVNELIVREVLRNINEEVKKEFYAFIFKHNIQMSHEQLPLSLIQKYQKLGLKKGDIGIAAFCEHVKANYLVTENGHFLKGKKLKGFKVVNLKGFIDALD